MYVKSIGPDFIVVHGSRIQTCDALLYCRCLTNTQRLSSASTAYRKSLKQMVCLSGSAGSEMSYRAAVSDAPACLPASSDQSCLTTVCSPSGQAHPLFAQAHFWHKGERKMSPACLSASSSTPEHNLNCNVSTLTHFTERRNDAHCDFIIVVCLVALILTFTVICGLKN